MTPDLPLPAAGAPARRRTAGPGRREARARLSSAWAAAIGALATVAAGSAQALTPAEVFAKVSPSVWRVHTFDNDGLAIGQGSGVVVGPGRLVTNCHVLARARQVQVRRETGGAGLPATLSQWGVHRDLCALQVPGLSAPAVVVQPTAQVVVGQPAYAIGHPKGLDLTMSAGLVSSLRRNAAQQLFLIQTSAAISGGSSGGGLFNERGELIGLTTIGSVGSDAQNLNFAIPGDWIGDLPRRHQAAVAAAANPGGAAAGAAGAARAGGTASSPR